MLRADAAEARGDAVGALAIMGETPLGPDGRLFWRPWRVRYLTQLAALGPSMPRWVTSRWALVQAMQVLDDTRREPIHKALRIAIDLRGGDGKLPGRDLADARARVMDHDWVFRQAYLYELGGLAHFMRRVAAPDLLAGADRLHDWLRATMGGYRLVANEPGSVTWEEVVTGEQVRVPNIGSGALVVPGECVIGRLAPIAEGWMFESAPLLVPERVALRVAHEPGDWIDALATGRDGADEEEIVTSGHTVSLLSDVPTSLWQYAVLGCSPSTTPVMPTPEHLAKGTLALVRWALDESTLHPGRDELDPWACLSASLLEPSLAQALAGMLTPGDVELFRLLSDLLAEPAAGVCRGLAGATA